LLLHVTGVLCVCLTLAAASIVYNARQAIRAEGDSFAAFARDLLAGVLMDPGRGPVTLEELQPYLQALDDLRHVRVELVPRHAPMSMDGYQPRPPGADVPRWFEWLMTAGQGEFFRAIVNGGREIGYLVVAADPNEEIEEVWEDVRPLLGIGAVLFAINWLLLFRAVGRGLEPLDDLLAGFEALERGSFPVTVREDVVPELYRIHRKFNWVAVVLEDTMEDNRALAAHMVDLREEERLTLARELHDELAPHLFGVKMHVAAARKTTAARYDESLGKSLTTIGDMIANLERVVRRMLHRLRPLTLDELGLEGALHDLVETWHGRGREVTCQLEMAGDLDDLDDTLKVTVYRIVQECLTNIARHASARVATVSVAAGGGGVDTGEVVEIRVWDNGRGMPAGGRPGFGLRGMQERVRALGGSFSLSAAGVPGFAVRAVIPLRRGQPAGNPRASAAGRRRRQKKEKRGHEAPASMERQE
jgi:two-component system sensor histidine kinase UhpB